MEVREGSWRFVEVRGGSWRFVAVRQVRKPGSRRTLPQNSRVRAGSWFVKFVAFDI